MKDNTNFLAIISKEIEKIILKSGIQKSKILGVGVGMHGLIDLKIGENFSFHFHTEKFENVYKL